MIKNKIKNIVLTPGHGGGDPGAVSNSGIQEAKQVIKICNYLAQYSNQFPMRAKITVEDAENRLNLAQSIQALNKKFWNIFNNNSADNFLLMEVHQDMNAPHLPLDRQKWQIGVYRYEGDKMSAEFASELIENCIANGAYAGTPSREDFDGSWPKGHYLPWRGFYLGFIQHTKALSMILECGYVSAEHTEEELQKLAWIIYQSLYEMIEGKKLIYNNQLQQEEIMFGQKKEELWNRLISDGGQYMDNARREVIRYALDNNDFNYIAGELVGSWRDIESLHKQIMELKNEVARLSIQQDNFLATQQDILANNVRIENPPVNFNNEAVLNMSPLNSTVDSIKTINHLNLKDKVLNSFKNLTANDKVKNASTDLINETAQATKTKSWKRFTTSLVYFFLTIGVVILNSIFPNNQAIDGIYQFISNTENLALITMLTGGYITGQTLTDIFVKNK